MDVKGCKEKKLHGISADSFGGLSPKLLKKPVKIARLSIQGHFPCVKNHANIFCKVYPINQATFRNGIFFLFVSTYFRFLFNSI